MYILSAVNDVDALTRKCNESYRYELEFLDGVVGLIVPMSIVLT